MAEPADSDRISGFRVNALFLDYDGTIAPLDVPLSKSKVSAEKLEVLNRVNAKIPVALISTKDIAFLVSRVPFARAWSGLGGLETRIGNVTVANPCLEKKASAIRKAVDYAKRFVGSASGLVIEEKLDHEGDVAAFSVDWRRAESFHSVEKQVSSLYAYCKELPLTCIRNPNQPFFDVFPCPIDKGEALRELKEKLNVACGVLYLGDSVVDNPAFEAADIAVGVIGGGSCADLRSDYLVGFEDVKGFLEELLRNNLHFRANMSMIRINRLDED